MRGSGRAWSSPEVFPERAIQYVTAARLRFAQCGEEKREQRELAMTKDLRCPLHELRVRFHAGAA